MQNIKMIIEYDGSFFHGFQKQKRLRLPTVQDLLEQTLSEILSENILTIGAGRTDTGVHALNQTVSFKYSGKMPPNEIKRALNAILREKIIIKSCVYVPDSFHARFSAKKRTYRYYILNLKDFPAIGKEYVYNIREKLNIDSMKSAANLFIGEKDFKGFSSCVEDNRSTIRRVFSSNIYTGQEFVNLYGGIEIPIKSSWIEYLIIYETAANGFLRSMVRMMTGMLIRIGRGKCKENEILKIIATKDSSLVHSPAPPHALFLSEVDY